MRRVFKTKAFVAVALVTLAAWAASYGYGAARNYFGSARRAVPAPASFREVEGRGLLVKTWVNGAGAYTFAIDTGAGATILSERVAREARVAIKRDSTVSISGLSGASNGSGREATLRELAIGYQDNLLPAHASVIVTGGLPPDIDGVLDPTESFAPLGYVIDLPKGEISAFDPRTNPVRTSDATPGGAVVPWVFQAGSKRPFVTLEGGRRALIDTGSGFGLAVNDEGARALGLVPRAGRERNGVRDLGGGQVAARRIAPATIMIGELELRRVPTDLISSERGAPILLGRDALAPF
ncbi:MAG: aspartyl protease family protein, partial [Pyrinomonadaceae bacterium]|nr:aspartyl protease family protein [Pyrinomonadaceae bacterium]